jgi:hypothetical protein
MYYPTLRYYQAITIDHTQVPADVSDMSMTLTASNLCDEIKTTSGSFAARSDGGDIRFLSDINLNTPIPFDLISFTQNATPANATAEIVVKVTASSATDTIIYVGWGDPNLTVLGRTNTYGRDNAYKSGWACWHTMKDDPDNSMITDRTVNDRTGSKGVAAHPAQGTSNPYINEYQHFVRANVEYIGINSFNTGNQFIIFEPLKYTLGTNPDNGRLVSKKTVWNAASGFEVTYSGAISPTQKLWITGSSGTGFNPTVFSNLLDNAWRNLAIRFNGTNCDVFVNTTKTTGTGVITSVVNNTTNLIIGYNGGLNDSPLQADVDSFSMYIGTLSDGEIQTMQNNQNSPGTFATIGTIKNVPMHIRAVGRGVMRGVGHGIM